jgi:hypothetical protein
MDSRYEQADEPDGRKLQVLATNPTVREVVIEEESWSFHAVPAAAAADEPHRVVFHSRRGGIGTGELPARTVLGTATDEELAELVRKSG